MKLFISSAHIWVWPIPSACMIASLVCLNRKVWLKFMNHISLLMFRSVSLMVCWPRVYSCLLTLSMSTVFLSTNWCASVGLPFVGIQGCLGVQFSTDSKCPGSDGKSSEHISFFGNHDNYVNYEVKYCQSCFKYRIMRLICRKHTTRFES